MIPSHVLPSEMKCQSLSKTLVCAFSTLMIQRTQQNQYLFSLTEEVHRHYVPPKHLRGNHHLFSFSYKLRHQTKNMVLVLAVYKIYIHLEYSRLKYFHQICNIVDLYGYYGYNSKSIIIGQIILKQTILNLIFFNRLAITFESFYKYKGVKRIIFVTLCTKLRKQNNDTENRQKSYLFLMHTNYIFIHILLFYKA